MREGRRKVEEEEGERWRGRRKETILEERQITILEERQGTNTHSFKEIRTNYTY